MWNLVSLCTDHCCYAHLLRRHRVCGTNPSLLLKNKDARSWWCLTGLLIWACMSCILLIPVLFALTFRKIRTSRRRVETTSERDFGRQAMFSREEVAVTRMMLIVYLAFLICWCPMLVTHVIHYTDFDNLFLHYSSSIMVLVNSAINPIVYAGVNKRLRRSFANLIKGKLFIPRNIDAVVLSFDQMQMSRKDARCAAAEDLPPG